MKKVKLVAYGTLRKGSYNYSRFKKAFGDDFNYLETTELKDFAAYPLTQAYPGLTTSEGDSVVVDVLEMSKEAYDIIDQMERGCGYTNAVVKIKDETIPIFLFPHVKKVYRANTGNEATKIKDWIEYEKTIK